MDQIHAGTEGGIQVYHVSIARLHEFLKKLLILLFWNRHSFFKKEVISCYIVMCF